MTTLSQATARDLMRTELVTLSPDDTIEAALAALSDAGITGAPVMGNDGRLIGALAGKAQHAERHVAAGVDVIIAQGAEAGGHTGEVGTMVLIPEIVDAVDIPVLGAGGIGRGRQMAAAMAADNEWLFDERHQSPQGYRHRLPANGFTVALEMKYFGARILSPPLPGDPDRADRLSR